MGNFIHDVLEKMQKETRNYSLGIERDLIKNKIPFEKDLALTIQGVRRCGKSTLLKQIAKKEKIESKAIFINFEDPRLAESLNHTLLDTIVEFHEKKSKENIFYFFDEIQNVKNWEKWLHIELEKKTRFFVITSSNSTLFSGKMGSALTGRHLTLELYPFSFHEYQKIKPNGTLETYLSDGGFPRAMTFEQPKTLLREYFSDIIERDVRRHVAARSSKTLMQIAKAVYESTGSETSYRKIADVFGTTPDTVKNYIHAFESAYLCLACPYFTYSERKTAVRPRKYYPIDLGLCEAIITRSTADVGKKIETALFHALIRKYKKVYYWRGHGEVDFIIETENGIQPIQITLKETQERHYKAIQEFLKEHPHSLEPLYVSKSNIEKFI